MSTLLICGCLQYWPNWNFDQFAIGIDDAQNARRDALSGGSEEKSRREKYPNERRRRQDFRPVQGTLDIGHHRNQHSNRIEIDQGRAAGHLQPAKDCGRGGVLQRPPAPLYLPRNVPIRQPVTYNPNSAGNTSPTPTARIFH